jgi:hypothetical protein
MHQINNITDNKSRSKSKQKTAQNQFSERGKNNENSMIQAFEEKNKDKIKSN